MKPVAGACPRCVLPKALPGWTLPLQPGFSLCAVEHLIIGQGADRPGERFKVDEPLDRSRAAGGRDMVFAPICYLTFGRFSQLLSAMPESTIHSLIHSNRRHVFHRIGPGFFLERKRGYAC
jgi:hypothetical protein